MTREEIRLEEGRLQRLDWMRWGPSLSLGYSARRLFAKRHGLGVLPNDHARSRAYRWSEDGLAGICDRRQFICFARAPWKTRLQVRARQTASTSTSPGKRTWEKPGTPTAIMDFLRGARRPCD